MKTFIVRHRIILIYGSTLAVLVFTLKWLELRFLIIDHALEVYVGAIALFFTVLGIWLALKLAKPKIETVIVEKEVPVPPSNEIDEKLIAKLGLSRRELEVLDLMAKGLSNQEIASKLFVSLNTVKTHTSNLFFKLDVKRRTQAVELAKRLRLV